MHRLRMVVAIVALAACSQRSMAQEVVTISFRNILRDGSFVAQFEQLDAQGAVVNVTTQTVANGAIGTISVAPGTRFNIRLLPDGGGGHTFANRELAADFAANLSNPLPLNGKYDPVTGKRIAVGLVINGKEILAPRMDYPGTEGTQPNVGPDCCFQYNPCQCYRSCRRIWWR